MGALYLIRHGQASYGEADYDRLSDRGQAQARAIGGWLARTPLDALYAGPHRRQQQTAALARQAAETAVEHVTLPAFAEYPAFEMLTHLGPRLAAADPKFTALQSAPTPRLLDEAFRTVLTKWASDEWVVDGVERVGAFVERVRDGLEQVIRGAGAGARIGCVTSAGPIGVAVGLAFGIAAERMVRTSVVVRNASITRLEFRSRGFAWHPEHLSLITFNSTAHLPDELDTHR